MIDERRITLLFMEFGTSKPDMKLFLSFIMIIRLKWTKRLTVNCIIKLFTENKAFLYISVKKFYLMLER